MVIRSRRASLDGSQPLAAAMGGAKTICLFGGVSLLINNITGSAMVLFPSLYQAAGWVVVSVALLAIAALSYLCSVMIIESMAAMPGNDKFEKRVEYSTLAYYYLGRRGYLFTQLFFQFSLACNNISSIIQSVQVMDFAISEIFGKNCGIPEFYPNFGFHCLEPVEGHITPFGDVYLLSIGFLVTVLVVVPFGFWNLDENIVIQKVACFLVAAMVAVWVGLFAYWGLDASYVPAMGDQYSQVLGVVLFNFAIITSIPSWVNEKKEGVSILKSMLIAIGMALLLFTLTGVFGGMAFEPWYNTDAKDQTLLNKLQDSGSVLAKVTFYLFPVVVNLTSIPIFGIMQRYNLLESGVCGPKMANFLGIILPWLLCVPFYTGSGFANIVNWGGTVFNSVINFIVPPLIYIAMVRKQTSRVSVSNERLLQSGHHCALASPAGVPGSVNPSLKQSLLPDGSVVDGLAYHASQIDVRSLEEEANDAKILGYDPYTVSMEEEERAAVLAASGLGGDAQAMSSAAFGREHSFTLASTQGWTAIPASWRPYRVHLAAAVSVLLTLSALAVIAVNIRNCIDGDCSGGD